MDQFYDYSRSIVIRMLTFRKFHDNISKLAAANYAAATFSRLVSYD